MLYSPLVPIIRRFSESSFGISPRTSYTGIIGDDALTATGEPVDRIVQTVVVNLAIKIALGDPGGRYVLQNVSLTQAPVYEEVYAHSFFSGHDLQIPWLLD